MPRPIDLTKSKALEVRQRLEADERFKTVPAELWTELRGDPTRAPEHLALAAQQYFAPDAIAWVDGWKAVGVTDPKVLADKALVFHARAARATGAAFGVGGFVTALPDLASLAWIQARLVFFMGAAYGFDPRDPMRPAELLVLQGVYDSVGDARAALDRTGVRVAQQVVKGKLSRDEALGRRLAAMAGKYAARKVGRRIVPGLSIVLNAVGNEREVRELAQRSRTFYGG